MILNIYIYIMIYIYMCVCVHSLSTIRETKQQNVRCNTPSSAIGLARSWHWHSSCLAPGATTAVPWRFSTVETDTKTAKALKRWKNLS